MRSTDTAAECLAARLSFQYLFFFRRHRVKRVRAQGIYVYKTSVVLQFEHSNDITNIYIVCVCAADTCGLEKVVSYDLNIAIKKKKRSCACVRV